MTTGCIAVAVPSIKAPMIMAKPYIFAMNVEDSTHVTSIFENDKNQASSEISDINAIVCQYCQASYDLYTAVLF